MGSNSSIYYNCFKRTSPGDFMPSDKAHNIVNKTRNVSELYCNEMVIVCRISLIENIEDVVILVNQLFSKLETSEKVTDKIYHSLILHKHLINDSQVTRLSRMHRMYSKKSDMNAYAITTLWMSLLKAYQD